MNNKGAITDIFVAVILIFVIGISSIAFIFISGELNSSITELVPDLQDSVSSTTNVSEIVDNTVGKTNSAIGNLSWIAVILVLGLILSSIVSNLFVNAHPVFLPAYIILGLIAVVFSVVVSNAYGEVIAQDSLSATANSFSALTFIMNNFPVIMTVTFFIGAIILFVNWRRGGNLL